MAALSSSPFLSSCLNSHRISRSSSSSSSFLQFSHLQNRGLSTKNKTLGIFTRRRRISAVAEETLIPELEEQIQDQTVSVPVSPSDLLTMFFKAEGTMNDSAVSAVTKALEETDGISDLQVQILEGIASVELTKQTTVQATGVASSLVEIIQGSGFKLQTLNLSFEDEEDLVD